jgi:hypothetical protein
MSCAVGGCNGSPTVILSGAGAENIVVNATSLVWGVYQLFPVGPEVSGISQCAVGNCSSTLMDLESYVGAPGPYVANAAGPVIGGASAYWIDGNGDLMQCALGGCGSAPSTFANATGSSLAADATNVYWSSWSAGTVAQCALAGCSAPTILANAQFGPARVAVDATSVYWMTSATAPANLDGAIWRCAIGGCGGSPTIVASGIATGNSGAGLAVDGTNVYWTGAAGIMRCSVNGCGSSPTLLVAAASPAAIALDATSVYWTETTAGTIMGKVMKATPK